MLNEPFSITWTDDGIKTLSNEIHSLKEFVPIITTVRGIVTCSKEEQYEKVLSFIVANGAKSDILVGDEH